MLRFSAIIFFGLVSLESSAGSAADTTARTSFFFSIDDRNSFITSTEAQVIGFRIGAEWNNKFRLGLGYHYLSDQIVRSISSLNKTTNVNTMTNADVRLRYGSIFGEYILLSNDFWQVTAPLLIGAGESAYIPPSNYYEITGRHFTLFIEPAVTVQYSFIPFIGIGTGFGYRFMPVGDGSLRSAFATPLYDFRIKILLDDVVEALFPNGLWKKKNEGEKSSAP